MEILHAVCRVILDATTCCAMLYELNFGDFVVVVGGVLVSCGFCVGVMVNVSGVVVTDSGKNMTEMIVLGVVTGYLRLDQVWKSLRFLSTHLSVERFCEVFVSVSK